MMKHAWKGYKDYAWGADDLNPVTKTPHYWYADHEKNSLLNTPIDAMDTLFIMGLMEEYKEAKSLVLDPKRLKFTQMTKPINVFETIIRVVGGLISAYELEGDMAFIKKAEELVQLILPVFGKGFLSNCGYLNNYFPFPDTASGFPVNNIKLGEVAEGFWYGQGASLAEIGTLQLEFQYLSDVTGNPIYQEKVR
jgi:hypothetical protein